MTALTQPVGRVIAVVGPSGVGKDSVMAGIRAARPGTVLARRVITRAPDSGGEDHRPATVAEFEAMVRAGAFAAHWGAHGLFYGVPIEVKDHAADGVDCLVNFSRAALTQAQAAFPSLLALNITASPEVLARRLAARGRESAEDIARRLAEADKPLPSGLKVVHLSNDGPLARTVARAVAALDRTPPDARPRGAGAAQPEGAA
ncbi:MAG: phosphonate metabolism protein/1,5-bisphosphokinase (PRPP-forming) PhnN [Pseudomonadota bacterium]